MHSRFTGALLGVHEVSLAGRDLVKAMGFWFTKKRVSFSPLKSRSQKLNTTLFWLFFYCVSFTRCIHSGGIVSLRTQLFPSRHVRQWCKRHVRSMDRLLHACHIRILLFALLHINVPRCMSICLNACRFALLCVNIPHRMSIFLH
jgi:hypothetical protein